MPLTIRYCLNLSSENHDPVKALMASAQYSTHNVDSISFPSLFFLSLMHSFLAFLSFTLAIHMQENCCVCQVRRKQTYLADEILQKSLLYCA